MYFEEKYCLRLHLGIYHAVTNTILLTVAFRILNAVKCTLLLASAFSVFFAVKPNTYSHYKISFCGELIFHQK
jgi:hypothetical protein